MMKLAGGLKTAVFSWLGYTMKIDDTLRAIRSAGFDAVMLWWDDSFPETYGRKEDLPDLARRNGLRIENAHLTYQGIDALWEDTVDGEEWASKLLRLTEQCADYGIPTVVAHLTQARPHPADGELGLCRLNRLAELAERRGINVAFENVRQPETLDYLFTHIDSPRFGVCFDSGHNHHYSPERNILKEFRDKIMAVHLHDNDSTADQHRIPFDGTIAWDEVMRGLAASTFNGTLALEVERDRSVLYHNMPVETFLEWAHCALQRLAD